MKSRFFTCFFLCLLILPLGAKAIGYGDAMQNMAIIHDQLVREHANYTSPDFLESMSASVTAKWLIPEILPNIYAKPIVQDGGAGLQLTLKTKSLG